MSSFLQIVVVSDIIDAYFACRAGARKGASMHGSGTSQRVDGPRPLRYEPYVDGGEQSSEKRFNAQDPSRLSLQGLLDGDTSDRQEVAASQASLI